MGRRVLREGGIETGKGKWRGKREEEKGGGGDRGGEDEREKSEGE